MHPTSAHAHAAALQAMNSAQFAAGASPAAQFAAASAASYATAAQLPQQPHTNAPMLLLNPIMGMQPMQSLTPFNMYQQQQQQHLHSNPSSSHGVPTSSSSSPSFSPPMASASLFSSPGLMASSYFGGPFHPKPLSYPASSFATSAAGAATQSASSAAMSSPGLASVGSSPSSSTSRLPRSKDKAKHSKSETRRRTRLRLQFELLRDTARSNKKDRYNILQAAVDTIKGYEARVQALEKEVRRSSSSARVDPARKRRKSDDAADTADSDGVDGMQEEGPLSSLKYFADIPACLLSLNGTVLDSNLPFQRTFGRVAPPASAASTALASPAAVTSPEVSPESQSSPVAESAAVAADGAVGGPTTSPSSPSSIFTLTHPSDLSHTFSLMQQLLTPSLTSLTVPKRVVTSDGRPLNTVMTLWGVREDDAAPGRKAGSSSRFVCVFVLEGEPQGAPAEDGVDGRMGRAMGVGGEGGGQAEEDGEADGESDEDSESGSEASRAGEGGGYRSASLHSPGSVSNGSSPISPAATSPVAAHKEAYPERTLMLLTQAVY